MIHQAAEAQKTSAPPTPEKIQEIGWGFGASMALATALEIDLFSAVATGARSVEEVAKATHASERGARMIADAMTGLGLLCRGEDGWRLAPDADAFLVRGRPGYLGDFLVFHAHEIAQTWSNLTASVRSGEPVVRLDRPENGVPFWHRLVDCLFPLGYPAAGAVGRELGRRHPEGEIRLLDVAAGSGVWGIGAAQAEPRIRVVATDLPETLEHTRRWVERTKTTGRVSFLPGDLRQVDFGAGAFDAAVLGHICHSEGADGTRHLLEKLARALVPGGTLVIVDFVPDPDRSGPAIPLLFALNMLLHTSEGDTFTFPEYEAWLGAAGFASVTRMPAPAPSPLILATRR